jgi:aspartate/methionine/tyrosine aminotransferase
VSQKAAEIALSGPQDCVAKGREIFRRRRDIVTQTLGQAGLLATSPQGAFYALVKIGDRQGKSTEFTKSLLKEHGVATVPGVTFGPTSDDLVRIAFTTSDDKLQAGVEKLRDYILNG